MNIQHRQFKYALLAVLGLGLAGVIAGGMKWKPVPVTVYHPVTMDAKSCTVPRDSGGALIVWTDSRTGSMDLYAQLLNDKGQPQWADSGVAVAQSVGDQGEPCATAVKDGWVVAWQDRKDFGFPSPKVKTRSPRAIPATKRPEKSAVPGKRKGVRAKGRPQTGLETYRDSRLTLRVQKLDVQGNRLWSKSDPAGVRLSTDDGKLNSDFSVVDDRQGGAFVIWAEHHYPVTRVLAQHMSAAGRPLWPQPLRVNGEDKSNRVSLTAVGSDSGSVMILWTMNGDTGCMGIHVSKVTSDGVLKWAGEDREIPSRITNGYYDLEAIPDGADGCFVREWCIDSRHRPADEEFSGIGQPGLARLYVQQVSSDGKPLWNGLGTLVAENVQASQNRNDFAASRNAGKIDGVVLAWNSYADRMAEMHSMRDGEQNPSTVYCQKILLSGEASWDEGGRTVAAVTGWSSTKSILTVDGISSDLAGGAIVGWMQQQIDPNIEPTADSHQMSRVNPEGHILWGADGIRISDQESDQSGFNLVPHQNSVLAVCLAKREWSHSIFARRISLDDGGIIPGHKFSIFDAERGKGEGIQMVALRGDRVAIFWREVDRNMIGLRYQILKAQDKLTFPLTGQSIWKFDQQNPAAAKDYLSCSDGRGGAFVGIPVQQECAMMIQLCHLPANKDTIVAEKSRNFFHFGANDMTRTFALEPDGQGGCFVAASEPRYGNLPQTIRMFRSDPDGRCKWGPATVEERHAFINLAGTTTTRDSSLIVIWRESGSMNQYDLHIASVAAVNRGRWFKVLQSANQILEAAAAPDGDYGVYVVWQSIGTDNRSYYGWHMQHLDSSGTFLWGDSGLVLNTSPSGREYLKLGGIATDSAGFLYLLALNDVESSVQKISPSGQNLWNSTEAMLPAAAGITTHDYSTPPRMHRRERLNSSCSSVWPDQAGGCFVMLQESTEYGISKLSAIQMIDSPRGHDQIPKKSTLLCDSCRIEEAAATTTSGGSFIAMWSETGSSEPSRPIWKAQWIENASRNRK